MTTAISAILITLVILVTIWVIIFGTAGAMMSRHTRHSGPLGFFLGAVLGPIGLLIIWLQSRRGGIRSSSATQLPTSEHLPKNQPLASSADEMFPI